MAADLVRLAGLDLVRTAPAVELGRADNSAGVMPTLFGHFSRFGEWYEISSWMEGNFLERVAPGAFAETAGRHWDTNDPHRVKVQFQHGMSYNVGDFLLAKLSRFEEDDIGGFYEAPLFDTVYNRELVPGLEAGEYGASFRFRILEESINEEPGVSAHNPRGIPEVTLLRCEVSEVGPVAFGASPSATAGVRSATDEFWALVREHDQGAYADACRAAGKTPPPAAEPPARERVVAPAVTLGDSRTELPALPDTVIARLDPAGLAAVCTRRRGQELVEARTVAPELTVTHDDAAGTATLAGYVVCYDVPLDDAALGWVEVWAPRACKRALDRSPDVRLAVNGAGRPVARTGDGSLRLVSDDLGLRVEVTVPADGAGGRVVAAVERGDRVDLRVGFDVRRQRWDAGHGRRDVDDVTLHDMAFLVAASAELDAVAVDGVHASARAAVAPVADGGHMSLALVEALAARFEFD